MDFLNTSLVILWEVIIHSRISIDVTSSYEFQNILSYVIKRRVFCNELHIAQNKSG